MSVKILSMIKIKTLTETRNIVYFCLFSHTLIQNISLRNYTKKKKKKSILNAFVRIENENEQLDQEE